MLENVTELTPDRLSCWISTGRPAAASVLCPVPPLATAKVPVVMFDGAGGGRRRERLRPRVGDGDHAEGQAEQERQRPAHQAVAFHW